MSLDRAMIRAERLSQSGNSAAAVEAWRDVLSEDPGIAEAHAALAMALVEQRRLTAAVSEAQAALVLDAENIRARYVLALTYFIRNRHKDSLRLFDEALAIAPWDVSGWVQKAQVLRSMGRNRDAEAAIEEASRLAPDTPAVLVELGWQARARRDAAAVQAISASILSRDPDNVSALVLMGHARRDSGNREDALDLAMSALSVDPRDSSALALLAQVKLSSNPIGGFYWHYLRLFENLSDPQRVLVATLVYLGYLMTGTGMSHAGAPEWVRWTFVALYLAISVGAIATEAMIDWMVQRELKAFRLRRGY